MPPAPLLADNVIGNRYLSNGTDARLSAGTLGALPDEMLMLLLEQLEVASLQALSASCRFLYALTHSDELCKAPFLKFAEKMDIRVEEQPGAFYWKPDCFGPDLFEVSGNERPAHRWLIVGPKRSGSTFHKDPNGTSAWNAVIQGANYWIMFPPTAQVPGVYISKDSSKVTSPLSIAEWLLTFHREARQRLGCAEGVCNAGEILHVPSGWWHLVSPSLRLLSEALAFLRDKPDQVSDFECEIEDPYALFEQRLRAEDPAML
ncbi:hypothetical protein PWT90_10847 [Aphanocladium album]|nr:hypothetical protein PWT90_10847 [Aphanocladium album]